MFGATFPTSIRSEVFPLPASAAKLSAPGQPRVQSFHGTTAALSWAAAREPDEDDDDEQVTYTVESCRLHSNEWRAVRRNLQEPRCLLENLEPGETYGFRVVSQSGGAASQPSQPSQPLAVPMSPGAGAASNPLRDKSNSSQVCTTRQKV